MVNKHETMFNYMEQCPEIRDLFLNFSTSEKGDTVIATSSNEFEVTSFIDGSALKWYDFAIIQYKPLTTEPNDTENATVMFDMEKVMFWLVTQDEAGNYPDFGAKCEIQEIAVLQNTPTVAGQDQNGAKYMFSCRVEYLERK